VPERRTNKRRSRTAAGGGVAAAVGTRLWTTAAHRPVDSAAVFCAAAASLIIIVNAVFLQSGPHPAPFFANPAAQLQAVDTHPTATVPPPPKTVEKPVEAPAARPVQPTRTPPGSPARRNDPIGDLIGASMTSPSRVAAVQRVLSDFGYGQLRASGTLDEPTSAAIQKFEGEHKLPVTGRLSDRLLNELAAMVGHPIQ
jgi:Putative peptidoglycan binding domain